MCVRTFYVSSVIQNTSVFTTTIKKLFQQDMLGNAVQREEQNLGNRHHKNDLTTLVVAEFHRCNFGHSSQLIFI